MPKYETRQRRELLSFLYENAHIPFSVSDIAKALKSKGISMSAIYRNLSDLEAEGKVQRVTSGGDKKVHYRYIGAQKCEKHIHLSCSKCGKTFHMDVPDTNNLIDEVMNNSDFKVDSSSTVLYGVCKQCIKTGGKV